MAFFHHYQFAYSSLATLLLLTVLATAALILTHYLVTVLAALMIGSYLLGVLLARRAWPLDGALLLRVGLAGALALLLVAPWLLNIVGGHLVRNAAGFVAGTAQSAVSSRSWSRWCRNMLGGAVLVFALAGLLAALWRREWRMALPAIWCALLVIAVVPYLVGLPGTGVIDTLTSLGTLYLPAALLAGYALALAQSSSTALLARLPMPPMIGAGAGGRALLLVIAANTGWQMRVVTGDTALVEDADMAAMQWIQENTPADARFVINSFPRLRWDAGGRHRCGLVDPAAGASCHDPAAAELW